MMCSQMPDTTRPIAKPESPLTKPPAKAAAANSVKASPSMVRSLERGRERLDGHPSQRGGCKSPEHVPLVHHHPPRLQDRIGDQPDPGSRTDQQRIADLPPEQDRQRHDADQ